MTRAKANTMTRNLCRSLASIRAWALSGLFVACCASGCGEGSATPPSPMDGGFRDGSVADMGPDMMIPVGDLGPDAMLGDMGSGADMGGATDMGGNTQVGDPPMILSVSWETSCSMGNHVRFLIVFQDEDTLPLNIDFSYTGMSGCFLSMVFRSTDQIEAQYTNCPEAQDQMPTFTLRDPENNSDTVGGFTYTPCEDGVFIP